MIQQSNVCGDCQYYEWDNPNANHIFYDGYCTKKKDEKDSDEIACQEFKGCNSCG